MFSNHKAVPDEAAEAKVPLEKRPLKPDIFLGGHAPALVMFTQSHVQRLLLTSRVNSAAWYGGSAQHRVAKIYTKENSGAVRATTQGASASMGTIGSTRICLIFVLLAPCVFVWLGAAFPRNEN